MVYAQTRKREFLMKKKIIFHLVGGLGNQMFQYACAYSFGKDNNVEVEFNITSYLESNRALSLQNFKITPMKLEEKWKKPSFWLYRILNKSNCKVAQKIFGFHLQNKMNIIDLTPTVWPIQRYLGFWQNEKFFEKYAYDIRKIFQLNIKATKKIIDEVHILQSERWVCVHYRRGDYQQHLDVYAHLSDEYYLKAIKVMEKYLRNPRYYVFSDDIDYAKSHWKGNRQRTVFNDHYFADYVDMHLMTKCSHYIIANSTFSWWGAYLSHNILDKLVIAPNNFFVNDKTFYPSEWIRIDN